MKGFTLIEIIVVVGTGLILSVLAAATYISFLRGSDVDNEARELQSVLNFARNKALASEEERSYGVHIATSTNEYFLFPGTAYVSTDPENQRYVIPQGITISSFALDGGGMDVVFSRLSGSTADYGSVTLQDVSDASRSATICIDETGSMEIRSACANVTLEYADGLIDGNLASFPSSTQQGDPAQSFTTGSETVYVERAELYIRRVTASASDVFLDIRSGSTVGPVLGRSWVTSGVSVPTNYSWFSFVFPRPVALSSNTQYFLRLRSLPDSTVSASASGTIYWAYEHAASAPPAYSGGDAWRYAGRNNIPSDQGQQLGPADQYDFSFRLIYGISPPDITDSRHMEFELEDSSDMGWSIQGHTTLRLTFHDPPGADVVQNITMAPSFSGNGTEFDWSGSVDVNGNIETLRIHTYYPDSSDTILSIHRDQELNQKAVDIDIDGRTIVSYTAGGTPTVGAWGGNMIYR